MKGNGKLAILAEKFDEEGVPITAINIYEDPDKLIVLSVSSGDLHVAYGFATRRWEKEYFGEVAAFMAKVLKQRLVQEDYVIRCDRCSEMVFPIKRPEGPMRVLCDGCVGYYDILSKPQKG